MLSKFHHNNCLVQHQLVLQVELHQDIIGAMLLNNLFIHTEVNQITHGQVLHVHFKRQCARILHCIEKDRGNGASDHKASRALVRSTRNVLTLAPKSKLIIAIMILWWTLLDFRKSFVLVPHPCTKEWNWLLTFWMTPCQPHRQHRPVRDPSCKENDNL